jgi:hypothetical protein
MKHAAKKGVEKIIAITTLKPLKRSAVAERLVDAN